MGVSSVKRILPIVLASGCGILALLDYLIASPGIDAIGGALSEGVIILAAFALILGVLNLIGVHGRRLAIHGERRFLSAILLIALVGTILLGLAPGGGQALAWIFTYLYMPLQTTLTALLAFFLVVAVYRAFRLRSSDAAILLGVSLFLLLAQLPLSGAISPYIPALGEWLLAVPVTAGMRGLILGVALGTMVTALRILIAIDQPFHGD